MNDLYVTLRYMTATAHKRYGLERSDPNDKSAGWFVEARQNEGYEKVRKLTRVRNIDALDIAHAVDDCSGTQRVITAAVAAQNRQHDQDRERRRAFLENQLVETQRELERIVAERHE
jgi:hypothetical protein